MQSKPHQDADPKLVFKPEGSRSWTFKPGALNIIWGKDPRYWKSECDYAELLQVCWLEVTGSVDENLAKGTSYLVKMKVEMKEGAFGWNGCPIYLMAKIGKNGNPQWKKITLPSNLNQSSEIDEQLFTVEVSVPANSKSDDTKLYFGLYEVWSGRWKGGLVIRQVEVIEKQVKISPSFSASKK